MMRILVITGVLAVLCAKAQQTNELGPYIREDVPAGAVSKRITMHLDTPPQPGDRFSIEVSTKKLQVVLVLPDGSRIGRINAGTAGLFWSEGDVEAPLGSIEGVSITSVQFTRTGNPGTYIVKFSAQSIEEPAWLSVHFISAAKDHLRKLKLLPGAQTAGPVTLSPTAPSATLPITLGQDEEIALFDIAVTEPLAKIILALPDGRVIGPQTAMPGIEWKSVQDPSELENPDPLSLYSIAGFLLRQEGTHHVVVFEKAARGRYEIRAERSASANVELMVEFVPFGRLQDLDKPIPGEVGLQQFHTLPEVALVGDNLDLRVGLTGDPVNPSSLRFEVRLEYREILPKGKTGLQQFGRPVVLPVSVQFTRDADGTFSGSFVPGRAGILRVGVHVEGKRTGGQPFTDEVILHGPTIQRAPATPARP